MPVNYGSNIPLSVLSTSEIGSIYSPEKSSNLGWLSVLLNVIEIGGLVLFGPEIGTGLALGNALGQSGIEYQETGKISAVNAGINFGSVIIPKIISGVQKSLFKSSELAVDVAKTTESIIGNEAREISTINEETKLISSITSKTELSIQEINKLKSVIEEGKINNLNKFRSILEKSFSRTGNSLVEATLEGTKTKKIIKLLSRTETTSMKLSRLSSKSMQWSTKAGGYLISPSSLAADLISKTISKITSKAEKIGEEIASKMKKWVKAGAKGLAKAEDEFVRTGGILFKSGWIMGYKVLQEVGTSSSIIIQFKNSHPNIIVKLTSTQLKAWAEYWSRGSWYINNVARSRGGRTLSELGIEGKLENLLAMLPISKINEIIGFASFSKGFVTQIRTNSGATLWHTANYIEGFETGLIQGIISEGIKSAVALGTQNQYAKQVLESGFGSVSSGTKFGVAFASSFSSGAQSMKDTIFEDTTKAGSIIKNINVVKGTGSSLKGIR